MHVGLIKIDLEKWASHGFPKGGSPLLIDIAPQFGHYLPVESFPESIHKKKTAEGKESAETAAPASRIEQETADFGGALVVGFQIQNLSGFIDPHGLVGNPLGADFIGVKRVEPADPADKSGNSDNPPGIAILQDKEVMLRAGVFYAGEKAPQGSIDFIFQPNLVLRNRGQTAGRGIDKFQQTIQVGLPNWPDNKMSHGARKI